MVDLVNFLKNKNSLQQIRLRCGCKPKNETRVKQPVPFLRENRLQVLQHYGVIEKFLEEIA